VRYSIRAWAIAVVIAALLFQVHVLKSRIVDLKRGYVFNRGCIEDLQLQAMRIHWRVQDLEQEPPGQIQILENQIIDLQARLEGQP
jgi:hypothetical protein